MSQPRLVYVETLHVAVRELGSPPAESPLTNAAVLSFDVGDDFPLDSFEEELRHRLAKEVGLFGVETRRSVFEVGATGIGTQLLVSLFSGGGTAALVAVAAFLKNRIPRPHNDFQWLRQLDTEALADALRTTLSTAIDARRAELRLVDVSSNADEVHGTFETSTGERYIVRSTKAGDSMVTLVPPPQP